MATDGGNKRWRLLLAVSLAIHIVLGALGYFYYDFHIFAVSVDRFVREGVSPYEWKEENLDWWFAYTPLHFLLPAPLLAAALKLGSPVAVRLALKAPAIAGDYLLAYAAWKRMGRRGAILVLYNPLVLYVSALRGHYDSLVAGFVALAYIYATKNKPMWTGLASGLAASTKQFSLPLTLPSLLLLEGKKKWAALAISLAVVVGVSTPFILRDPVGFEEYVRGQHTAKGAWNFGYAGLANLGSGIVVTLAGGEAAAGEATSRLPRLFYQLSAIPLLLGLAAYLLDVARRAREGRLSVERLAWIIPLSLVLGHAVNIQYAVYLVAYNIAAGEFAQADKRFYLYATLAGMIDSCELCKSIPPLWYDPRDMWGPVIPVPGWGLGIMTTLSGLLYFIGIYPYAVRVARFLAEAFGSLRRSR